MKPEELLEHRNYKLTWVDPVPGLDSDGRGAACFIYSQMTVQDAINYTRANHAKQVEAPKDKSDLDLLFDFMAINWADYEE